MYADGYLSDTTPYSKYVGITLSSKDREHLEKFNSSINSNYQIRDYEVVKGYKIGSPYSRIIITSEKMYQDLILQGCVPHKTNGIKPPLIGFDFDRHFIRGYLDGDGSISRCLKKGKFTKFPKYEYQIKILGTIEILDYIKDFIENNNVATIRHYFQRKPNQKVHSLEFGGNKQVKKFLDIIYANATVYLSRKYDRYLDLCKQ